MGDNSRYFDTISVGEDADFSGETDTYNVTLKRGGFCRVISELQIGDLVELRTQLNQFITTHTER
jgi:hypothetical protein